MQAAFSCNIPQHTTLLSLSRTCAFPLSLTLAARTHMHDCTYTHTPTLLPHAHTCTIARTHTCTRTHLILSPSPPHSLTHAPLSPSHSLTHIRAYTHTHAHAYTHTAAGRDYPAAHSPTLSPSHSLSLSFTHSPTLPPSPSLSLTPSRAAGWVYPTAHGCQPGRHAAAQAASPGGGRRCIGGWLGGVHAWPRPHD